MLDDGNVVVGYGSNPWIGEYTYGPLSISKLATMLMTFGIIVPRSDGRVIFFATLGKDGEEGNSPMQVRFPVPTIINRVIGD